MRPGETDPVTPRPTDWEKDGVGVLDNGSIALRDHDAAVTYYSASRMHLCELLRDEWRNKIKIEEMERMINAREPKEFIPRLLEALKRRATECDDLRHCGMAGKIMLGQAQGYRDAIALIESFLP